MIMLIIVIYVVILILCLFAVGYFDLEAEFIFVSIFWPITLPILTILIIGAIFVCIGKYIKEKPEKDFITYVIDNL